VLGVPVPFHNFFPKFITEFIASLLSW